MFSDDVPCNNYSSRVIKAQFLLLSPVCVDTYADCFREERGRLDHKIANLTFLWLFFIKRLKNTFK